MITPINTPQRKPDDIKMLKIDTEVKTLELHNATGHCKSTAVN